MAVEREAAELPLDRGLGVRAAIAVSAAFHLLLFLVAPLVEGYIGTDERPSPPAIEYVKLDGPPPPPEEPAEAKAEPEKPPEETPTPEATPPPEEAKATEEQPGADEAKGPDAAPEPGEAEGGDAPEPPPAEATHEPPPEPPPAPLAAPPVATVAAALPEGGGNADAGEERPQGTEEAPPAASGAELPPDAAPIEETTALGTEVGPEVVVPEEGAEVQVLPGYAPGANVTTDTTKYDWGPYMTALWKTVDPRISPRLPRAIPSHAINPVLAIIVARDGNIRSTRLNRSSGIVEIDDAVIAGVGAGPMPVLPTDFAGDAKTLLLEFQLPRNGP